MQVVGVTGYAQHGKDTFGRRLAERYGFRRYAFADGVRDVALAVNPIVYSDGGEDYRVVDVVAAGGWERAKRFAEVRRLLQRIGTEGGRDIHGPDVWVNALARRVAQDRPERVVVTDVRFPNEAAWVHAQGGVLVRVRRVDENGAEFNGGADRNHPSEAHVAGLPADVEVTCTTVDGLHAWADWLALNGLLGDITDDIRRAYQ